MATYKKVWITAWQPAHSSTPFRATSHGLRATRSRRCCKGRGCELAGEESSRNKDDPCGHEGARAMFLSRDQARDLDCRAIDGLGMPGVVLMENAGRNIAELARSLGAAGPVAICCGPGNNGGDGFVMARHLDNAGV